MAGRHIGRRIPHRQASVRELGRSRGGAAPVHAGPDAPLALTRAERGTVSAAAKVENRQTATALAGVGQPVDS
jgi:hypothetical protein